MTVFGVSCSQLTYQPANHASSVFTTLSSMRDERQLCDVAIEVSLDVTCNTECRCNAIYLISWFTHVEDTMPS